MGEGKDGGWLSSLLAWALADSCKLKNGNTQHHFCTFIRSGGFRRGKGDANALPFGG